MAGAGQEAARRGYRVVVLEDPIVGDARTAGPELLARAGAVARETVEPCCVVSSGETTVHVMGKGRGGRNQELALATAPALAQMIPCVLVSVGTDGVDGPTDAAGAIADMATFERASRAGLPRIDDYLRDNDAYSFFDRLGDLVRTGPTHTNVGDLQVVLFPGRSPSPSSGYSGRS